MTRGESIDTPDGMSPPVQPAEPGSAESPPTAAGATVRSTRFAAVEDRSPESIGAGDRSLKPEAEAQRPDRLRIQPSASDAADAPTQTDGEQTTPSVLVPADFDPRHSPLVTAPSAALLEAIATERLDPAWLRRRFTHPPSWKPEQTSDRMMLRPGPPRPAAVLVPIVAHGGAPTVLLTQRTLHLRNHSGQIAFPGGRFEPQDGSPVRTALREAQEEVGLDPERVEVIGRLPDYLTGTGYRVTPVVGLIQPGESLHPDPHEVAAIFEVPLGFLMDPRHHEQRLIEVPGGRRMFWAMPYRALDSNDEHFIWGATAAMLRNLYRLLAA